MLARGPPSAPAPWNSAACLAVEFGVNCRTPRLPWLVLAAAIIGGPALARAQSSAALWSADFGDGWMERWTEVRLDSRINRFTVFEDEGRPVLRVESDNSASALWHPFDFDPVVEGRTWRWRVEATLAGNRREREKPGDDYAARFFVIFDGDPFSSDARAICYVWAAREPVGATFPNPYVSNVTTVVLQSGDERAGLWVREERDFMADYLAAFGEAPRRVTAVAVMADTDDTSGRATSWFTDITLVSPHN